MAAGKPHPPELFHHPARKAAFAAGEKVFVCADFPCAKNPKHIRRYAEYLDCADCSRESKQKSKPTRVERKATLGGEVDHELGQRRLVSASQKFLRLLYAEKLKAIRTGIACANVPRLEGPHNVSALG